jgi:hypothetical protein
VLLSYEGQGSKPVPDLDCAWHASGNVTYMGIWRLMLSKLFVLDCALCPLLTIDRKKGKFLIRSKKRFEFLISLDEK